MKKILLLFSFLLFISCQNNDNDSTTTFLSNTLVGIEKITLNGKDYVLPVDNFMPDKDNCPLLATGSYASSNKVELEYVWNGSEPLSSVEITCKNPTAHVESQEEIYQSWKIFHLTITTSKPQAEVIYTISSFQNKANS